MFSFRTFFNKVNSVEDSQLFLSTHYKYRNTNCEFHCHFTPPKPSPSLH